MKRFVFNIAPVYRRTGGRVCFASNDFREMHVTIRLRWATRNYVGTVFGGSIYGSIDPIYMLQFIGILGKDYIVWDKAATIQFLKPIKGRVFARFLITDEILEHVHKEISSKGKVVLDLPVEYVDKKGLTYFEAKKTLYIASKSYYKDRLAKKEA